MKNGAFRLLTVMAAASWVFAVHGSGSDVPGDDGRYIRAYFNDRNSAYEALYRFEAQAMEISYEKQYIIFKMTPEEISGLSGSGWRIVDEPGYERSLRRIAAQPSDDGTIPGYPSYYTVEKTYALADSLAAAFPKLARVIDAGDSWEKTAGVGGYDIKVLRCTNADVPGPKPKFCVTGSMHAREYTTVALCYRFALYLLQNYGKDADVTWLLDHHEYHAYLIVNPDGRKHAEKGKYWRKNTNTAYCKPDPNMRGVDLNRNAPYKWGSFGSNDECAEDYYGPSAASEPEMKALVNYLDTLYSDSAKTGVYIDLHSFGQIIYRPTEVTTLYRKVAFFDKYGDPKLERGEAWTYVYYTYGTATMLFELGTTFFQKCDFFENDIIPKHIPAFVYVMKACREPLKIAQGPDAIDCAISGSKLTATIDDTRYYQNNPTHPITAAEYYVRTPPWLPGAKAIPMTAVDGSFNATVEKVSAPLVLDARAAGEKTIVYVRGKDASGNWGAVSGVFHEVATGAGAPAAAAAGGEIVVDCPRTLTNSASVRIYFPRATALRLSFFDLRGRSSISLIGANTAAAGWHTFPMPRRLPAEGVYALRISDGSGWTMERRVLVR